MTDNTYPALTVETVDYQLTAWFDDRPGVGCWRLDISMDDGPEFYSTFEHVLLRVLHIEQRIGQGRGVNNYFEYTTSRKLRFLSMLATQFPEFEYDGNAGVYWVYVEESMSNGGRWSVGFDDMVTGWPTVRVYARSVHGEEYDAVTVANGKPGQDHDRLGPEHVVAAAAALKQAQYAVTAQWTAYLHETREA